MVFLTVDLLVCLKVQKQQNSYTTNLVFFGQIVTKKVLLFTTSSAYEQYQDYFSQDYLIAKIGLRGVEANDTLCIIGTNTGQ